MAFDGKEGEQISLEEAAAMTATYRDSERAWGAKAHFMGKDILLRILNQTGCVGIRSYHAIDTDGNKQLVVVGVDANENDITTGLIADRAVPCPANCGTNGALQ